MKKFSPLTSIATVYLILFCIQFLPIEGHGVDYLKFTAMAIAPVLFFIYTPRYSLAVWGCLLYFATVITSILLHDYYRMSSIVFSAMFLVMYPLFYNLIYDGAFSLKYFIMLMKALIYAYTICLILQQLCVSVGIHYFPLFNLVNPNSCAIDKLNSLSHEPSSSARTLGCCFYALLKTTEFEWGKTLEIKQFWKLYKWPILAFLYSMCTMGSGTAFACLMILSLYFLKKKNIGIILTVGLALYILLPLLELRELDRAVNSINGFLSFDRTAIIEADGSAATRILPMFNTLQKLDLFQFETWFGYGLDYGLFDQKFQTPYSAETMIGCITSYGFLAYLVSLFLVFTCCIRPFLSIPTLMFFAGVGGGVGNIQYQWGLLMIFTCVSYFWLQDRKVKMNNQELFESSETIAPIIRTDPCYCRHSPNGKLTSKK